MRHSWLWLWCACASLSCGGGTQSVHRAGAQELHPMPPLVTRAEWSARAPQCSASYCSPWEHVTIHHTAGPNDYAAETLDDCKAVVRAIQAYHMDVNGWCDVGYNFLACKTGHLFVGRDDSLNYRRGAHDAINCPGLGVAALGYFHEPYNHQPTPELIDSLESLIAWQWDALGRSPYGTGLYGGNVENIIGGHRDVKATACPGDILYDDYLGADPNAGAIRDGVCAKMDTCTGPVEPEVLHVAALTVTVASKGRKDRGKKPGGGGGGGGGGRSWQAQALVSIADAANRPAAGSAVTVEWTGLHQGTSTGTTAGDGTVTLKSPGGKGSGTTTACVVAVSRSGASYDPGANTVTCGSVTR